MTRRGMSRKPFKGSGRVMQFELRLSRLTLKRERSISESSQNTSMKIRRKRMTTRRRTKRKRTRKMMERMV